MGGVSGRVNGRVEGGRRERDEWEEGGKGDWEGGEG